MDLVVRAPSAFNADKSYRDESNEVALSVRDEGERLTYGRESCMKKHSSGSKPMT